MKQMPTCLLTSLFTFAGLLLPAHLHAQDKVTFDDHVKPLFAQRCAACHNPNKKSADLDLTNYTAMMQGGGSGTVIEPGDAGSSYLYSLVTHEDSPEMPPDSDRIPAPEIEILKKWIDGGALENKSSKAMLPKKKKLGVVDFDPSQRPEFIPTPCRLSLEADVVPHRQPIVTAAATSPWAPIAAIAGAQQITLYDTNTLELLGVLAFPEGQVNVLKFSRNGSLLLAGGGRSAANGVAIAWDIQTGERVIEITGEIDAVLAADINKDHTLIAVGGPQKLVKVFDTNTGKVKFEMKKHTDWVQAIEFSPDGVLLASGDRAGNVVVWEAFTGREYLDLNCQQVGINDVTWRIDSNVLATAGEDATIKLWEMENGGEQKKWAAHGGGVLDIEYTRDSRIVSSGRDNHSKVFDQNGGQQKAYPFPQYATAVTHCDETNRLISCGFDGAVTVHNLADDQVVGTLLPNPATLDQRLAEAEKQVAEVQAQFAAADAAANAAKMALDEKMSQFNTAQAQQTELTQKLGELEKLLGQSQTDLTNRQGQMQSATEAIGRLTPGLANVGQAIEAIDRAQSTMKSEQLQASRAQLTTLKKEHETQLSTNNQLVTSLKPQIETLQAEIAKTTAQQEEMKKTLQSATQIVQEVQPMLEPLAKDHQAKAAAVATIQPTLQMHQNRVATLQAAKQFETAEQEVLAKLAQAWTNLEKQAEQIGDIQTQLAAKTQEVQTQQAQVDQLMSQVTAWTQSVAEKQKAKQTLTSQITTAQQQKTQHQSELDNLAATDEKLQQSLAALQSALELDSQDQALQTSQASLVQVIQQRNEQAAALKQKNTELDQQIAAWNQQIQTTDTEVAALQMQITTTAGEIEKAKQVLQPLVVARDEIQTSLDNATQQLESLTAQHDATRGELMVLREVEQREETIPVSTN